MNQEKLLSELKVNDQAYTLNQNIQKESVVETTKNLTEVKVDKSYLESILDDWDNWYPDPS